MQTSEIRKRYLDFFAAKGHRIVRSAPLIPAGDPTLLFTGAGMNQFKEYFLGLKKDMTRAASVQKCLRTGDLDQVGRTPYHHSFFEMLGNFSFGDYFKEEAISWAWEFFTDDLGLDKKRLFVSVHKSDREAFDLWVKKIGISKDLIARLGDETNFWPANAPKDGPNGPCGPCSEIYYDQGGGQASGFWADDETGRYAEIWNLVFTQFNREEGGRLTPLKAKNIDTGMGLERLACVLQGKKNNFETDQFALMLDYLQNRLKIRNQEHLAHLYAIMDHVRAATVAIADGAHPSNEGRGYVIRKLIRRAVWHIRQAELGSPLLGSLVPFVVEHLGPVYPELAQAHAGVEKVIRLEEERFQETLDRGLDVLSGMMEAAKKQKLKRLSGEHVFQLYDTYGFPDELTVVIAKREGFEIDREGFNVLLEDQRKRAKESTKIAASIFAVPQIEKEILALEETKFLGYRAMESDARVVWLSRSGDKGVMALDQTPFYAESGGQVGDQGILTGKNLEFRVCDTQKHARAILHYGAFIKGNVKIGDAVHAQVDPHLRHATKRNHTATHLLHAALREQLGPHVRQMGSLVNPDKLRFDFTHPQALSQTEIHEVEQWVNRAVLDNIEVEAKTQRYEEATQGGALAFFGDKYGDEVRTIHIPGKSKELCGGTHCTRTGDIGGFIITSESSVGSGTRRLEAVTGLGVIRYGNQLKAQMDRIAGLLKTTADDAPARIEKLRERVRELEKSGVRGPGSALDLDRLIETAQTVKDVKLITYTARDQDLNFLRGLADRIKPRTARSVLVLFATQESKTQMVVTLTRDLEHSRLDARSIAEKVAPHLEGSAGGRKDWAQGGGKRITGIAEALKALPDLITEAI